MQAPTPAQGFPETTTSLRSLPSFEGLPGTDPRTPGSGSPLAPGGLAATLRKSPSREQSPEADAKDERTQSSSVSVPAVATLESAHKAGVKLAQIAM